MSNGKLVSVVLTGYESKGALSKVNGEYKGTIVHTLKETHNKVEATCLTAGHEAYYECDCGACFSDSTLTQEILDLEVWLGEDGNGYIPAEGHTYGEVNYTWNGDKCTAIRCCNREGCSEIESETVTGVYVKDTDATYESNEKGHYEAVFENTNLNRNATEVNSIERQDTKLSKQGLSVLAIVCIIIGTILLISLVAYILMFFIWKKKGKALKLLVPSFTWINSKIFKK